VTTSFSPKRKTAVPWKWVVGAFLLATVIFWLVRHPVGLDWASLISQLRSASPLFILAGVASIWVGYLLRAWRWSVMLSPRLKVSPLATLPSQVLGFTISGLLGRAADLGRPYLIARRLNTPVAAQVAVYSVERAFDLGSAALLFSLALVTAPASLPHHEAFAHAGLLSLSATIFLAIFAFALRAWGEPLASVTGKLLAPVSPDFAAKVSDRLLEFRSGLEVFASTADFAKAAALSLVMWGGIAFAYFACARAFQAEPTLASFTFAETMLLMATGIGGSALQLPVLGWFTQTALLAATLHKFFTVPLAPATACGAVLVIVSYLSVIPFGLFVAQRYGIRLRDTVRRTVEAETTEPA
jgi:glycosyltransferase 2 family protein